MTTLRFYQGLCTIGGTVVEIAAEGARCLFDFGIEGSTEMDRRVYLRPSHMVSDLLKTGGLPPVPGLYGRADLGDNPLAAFGEMQPRPFVLISHMHIDHMGALGALCDQADVYMTEESLCLYQGLAKTGDIFFRPHLQVIGVKPLEWISRGSLRFRAIPVDHDVPGACGFEIETPDGRVLYTGDLRIHGFRGEDTMRFASLAAGADILITEGVTTSFIEDFNSVVPGCDLSSAKTERSTVQDITSAAVAAKGIVFLNVYNRNLDRLEALLKSLNEAGRQLVLEPETVLLLRHCRNLDRLFIYQPLVKPGDQIEAEGVTREELQSHPEKYVLQLSYEHLLESLDFAPETSLYIHANGVPLGAYDPSYQRLSDFLARQGIPYLNIGSGGHAAPEHLKYILETIAPKYLIPLHSLTPEKIRIDGSRQVLPKAGESYRLKNGELLPDDVA